MTPRRVAVIVVGVVVVVLAAWLLVYFRPKGEELDDLRQQVAEAQREEQSLRATLRRLDAIDADRPALEAELRRLIAGVPPDPQLASFILAAHDIAERAEIDFLSITPALPDAEAGEDVSTIAMGVTIEGGFFAVLDYLNRLEGLDRIVVVDSITVSAVTAEEEVEASGLPPAGPATGGAPVAAGAGPLATAIDTVETVVAAQVIPTPSGPPRLRVELQARAFTTAVSPETPEPPDAAAPDETTTTTAAEGG